MSWLTLFRGSSGLNNVVDPARLAADENKVTPLAVAYNVDHDLTGRVSRRRGYTQKRSEASHSGFCQGGDCLFVAGSGLYRLAGDYSRELLRGDLTENAPMSYVQVAGRIYYSNGLEKGYVPTGGPDRAWEAAEYQGPTTRKLVHGPVAGHLLSFFDSCVLVAKESVIYRSERFNYGWFRRYGFVEAQRITLMQPVPGGLFVATPTRTFFYAGESIEALQRRPVAHFGAIEGTVSACPASLLGLENLGGTVYLWATTEGLCVGGPGGYFKNLTETTLTYPAAQRGCGIVHDSRYLALLTE